MILQGRLIGVVSSIFLIVGFLANTAYAKNNDEITYLPNWAVGDSASYKLVQKSTKCKYSVTSHVNIKVIEKNRAGYVLEWRLADMKCSPEYNELPMETQASLDTLAKIEGEKVVRYRTNNNGVFQEIVNVDEIQTAANRSLDVFLNRCPEGQEKEKLKDIRQKMMQNGALIKSPSKELASLHSDFICGRSFQNGQTYSAEVQIPNIFDSSLPVEGTMSLLASHDGNVNQYKISNLFNRETVIKSVSSMLRMVSGNTLDVKLKEFEQAVQDSELVDNYQITILDGENWIEQCSFERKTTVQGKVATENFIITRERE